MGQQQPQHVYNSTCKSTQLAVVSTLCPASVPPSSCVQTDDTRINILEIISAFVANTKHKNPNYQFDDFDQHPIVGRCGHQLEENRRQRKVVLWVFACQLANHINGCGLHARIGILQFLLQLREGRPQRFWIAQEHLVHHQNRLHAQIRFGGAHLTNQT